MTLTDKIQCQICDKHYSKKWIKVIDEINVCGNCYFMARALRDGRI